MTVIKNITEGLVFAETPNGLKGLQPEETLAVSECLNYATLLEAGFVVALAEDEEVVKEENSEEANKEQGSEEVVKEENSEEANKEQGSEEEVKEENSEEVVKEEQGSEEVVKEENSEEANKEQGSEVIKDEVVKTKKAQAKKNK